MKIPLPLLLFSLIHFSDGCLKINILPPTTTLAPNACRCEALPLNSTTIHAYIQPSNPFYLVLSTAILSAPTVSIDECSAMMWCDGDYSLVVFDDTSLGKIFGAYPANGFCDAESQEWLVDTRDGLGLTRFNQLYGICFIAPTTPSTTSSTVTTPSTPSTTRSSTTSSSTVTTPTTTSATTTTPVTTSTTTPSTTRSSTIVSSTVTTPTTPTTTSQATTTTTVTSTTSICDCEYVALDRFTIRDYITSDNLFYNDLTSETVVLPTVTNESCSVTMTCPTGYSILVLDRTNLGKLVCILNGIQDFFVFIECIEVQFETLSASGQCDTTTNKWKVDTGSRVRLTTFNQMYGICVVNDSGNPPLTISTLFTTPPNVLSTTSHMEPVTTTDDMKCHPRRQHTYLFAYSTDFDTDLFRDHYLFYTSSMSDWFTSRQYKTFVTIRFDTVVEEDFQYHKTFADMKPTVMAHLPDPSLGFKNNETGSDILKMIEKFIDTHTPDDLCIAKMYILVKRYPNEVDIARIVEKLRFHHMTVYLFVSTTTTGGLSSKILYDLMSKTNGLCIFDDDSFPSFLNSVPNSGYLHYAANPTVSGQGKVDLPNFASWVSSYHLIITVQDHMPFDSFNSIIITGDNSYGPMYANKTYIFEMDDVFYYGETNAVVRFSVGISNVSSLTLQYDYSSTQVLQLRMFSTYPSYLDSDSWPEYYD